MKKWQTIACILLLTAIVALVSMQFVPEEKRSSVLIVIGLVGAALAGVVAFLANWRTIFPPEQEPPAKEHPGKGQEPEPKPQSLSPLHQVPPPVEDFTGREGELAELLEAVRKGGATISGLQGMGGVGKSELAKVLARQLKDDFPDAQIFLNLKGTSQEPLTAAEALAHVVQAFYPKARLPEDEQALRGAFCDVLDGKQALLVMDNARDRAQVEPLIPPAGSVLIVTSRQRFALPNIKALDLSALPMEKAVKLLVRIAPRIKPRAEEVAELCARLPLALRAVASALAVQDDLSVKDMVKRLQDKKKRLKLTGAGPAIAASYDLLPRELRARWRLLAVFPGDFDHLGAAAVWDCSPDEAKDSLSALRRASILEWNESTGRYRLHDLARDFAESRLQRARAEAEKRHAEHYKRVLAAANVMYLEGGDDTLRGLALFDRERANIEAGQAWAAANAEENETAARLASAYPDAGVYVLALRQHPRQWIRWLEAALAAARGMNDRAAEGNHIGNLGLAYARLGETRKAIETYEHQLAITRKIGDRRGGGNALGNLGNAYAALGETRKAIETYEQRLDIAREIGDRRGEGNALGNLGIAYADLGETRKAIETYEQRLDIAREIGDRRGEGNALGNLGNAYADLGETRKAIEYYEHQLAITRKIGDRRGEGNALGGLGNAYLRLGETRKAIEYYEQALDIHREIGGRLGEAQDCWNLGLAYEELGDLARAAERMQVCVDYERELGHADAEMRAARVEEVKKKMRGASEDMRDS